MTPPLAFSSAFESGNLATAFRAGEHEYNLVLAADTGSHGFTQWFYFAIKGLRRHTKYTFNIINNEKVDSQFNYGMQPLMYCEKHAAWRRVGEDVSYFENPYKKPSRDASEMMACYTVRFTFKLPSSFEVGSWHYLAYCYPYTYSDLQNDLTSMLSLDPRAERVRSTILCKTLSGLDCPC